MLTLMDRYLAGHKKLIWQPPPEHAKRIAGAAQHAHKFVFSEAASDLAGGLAFGPTGKLILDNRQFALPPYPVTYVEFNSRRFHNHTQKLANPDIPTDWQVGYLWAYDTLYSFVAPEEGSYVPVLGMMAFNIVPPGSSSPANGNLVMIGIAEDQPERTMDFELPAGNILNPNRLAEAMDFHKNGVWMKLATALGTTLDLVDGDDQMMALNWEIGIRWLNPTPKTTREVNATMEYMRQCAGDVRNFWTLLLWINRPSKIIRLDRPAGSRLFRGKRVAFSKHTVIDIDLNKKHVVYINQLKRSLIDRASPLLHEVRGHFKHHGGDEKCSHVWPLVPDEKHHWVCSKCGRMRWWMKDHRRGDATRGVNIPDYSVSVGER